MAGVFPTIHNLAMRTCDVSPDGSTLLCMHGHRVARIDTKTGTERDPSSGLSQPSGVTWSPDGKRLFTRAVRHDRTWTAWDAVTGKRLYDVLPTGFVSNNEWKMMPDLFFIHGGKELVAGLEKSEKTERIGARIPGVRRGDRQAAATIGRATTEGAFSVVHPDRRRAGWVVRGHAGLHHFRHIGPARRRPREH